MVWWILAPVAAAAIGWASSQAARRLAPTPALSPASPLRRRVLAVLILADLAAAILTLALVPGLAPRLVTLGLGWSLILLACVDVLALRLPDVLTLPLVLIGLAVGAWTLHAPFSDHLIGAAASAP